VYVLRVGFDWQLLPRIGVRAQLGLPSYNAPNLTRVFPSTGESTEPIEPMLGFYYQF
jgi:hypothetical protein